MRTPLPLLLTLLLCTSSASSALAQEQPLPAPRRDAPLILPMPDRNQPLPPRPQKKAPPAKAAEALRPDPLPSDPKARLDALFGRLQNRENPEAARAAEKDIERLFERSGSPTVDLMLTRAGQAIVTRDFDLALDLLDYTTSLRPGFAEGYHRRAQVHLLRNDEEAALRDLRMTLGLEPRHFPALAALAAILSKSGDKRGAYKALVKLRDINPHHPEIGTAIDRLKQDVDGQAI